MGNKFAIAALLAILLFMGWLFFQVVRPFLTSLFVAAVLAVMFRPMHERMTKRFGDHKRLAALVTTIGIVVLILVPIGGGLILAGNELVDLGREFAMARDPNNTTRLQKLVDEVESSWAGRWYDRFKRNLEYENQINVDDAMQNASASIVKNLSEKTIGFMADVFAAAVGLAVMVLALYYFFADGEHFLAQLEYFSPLKYEDDLALWRQFECISRSVVLGTVVAGLGQAILAGVGFLIIGVERIWLLTALTWLAALLPFVGAATIWGVVCVGLLIDQHYWSAGFLALYGVIVVSSSDNLIRAYIIGGNSKLHPLVVLVSVLGALQFIGLWGIFFGPMIASLFYALLKILRKRLPETAAVVPDPVAPCDIRPPTPAPQPTETECLYLV